MGKRQAGLAGVVRTMLVAGALVVGLSGCDQSSVQRSPYPELVWSGRPVELNGQPLGPNAVRLDIYRDPEPNSPGELRYEITSGCHGSGTVKRDGSVSASEVLSPCSAADIAVLGRLIGIAPGSLPGPTPPPRLTWTNEAAVLSSGEGQARFVRIQLFKLGPRVSPSGQ